MKNIDKVEKVINSSIELLNESITEIKKDRQSNQDIKDILNY
jgi:hypothetical protein